MRFIEQAYKGKNDGWRYFITLFIVTAPFYLNFFIYLFAPEIMEQSLEKMRTNTGDKNVLFLNNLLPFLVLLVLLILFVVFLHKRSFTTVMTSRKHFDWKRFFTGFFIWLVFSVVLVGLSFILSPENMVWNFKPASFFVLLLLSLVFIPIQTSLEELLFRGYIMQGIGIWAKNRWLPLVLTSIIFGLLHGFNPEVAKLGMGLMVYYIGTGLLFGCVTLMDEGTELSMGMHAVNNIVAATFVTMDWAVFQTDALFIDVSEPSMDLLAYVPVFIIYPLLFFVLYKKYQWSNWKDKLFGPVSSRNDLEIRDELKESNPIDTIGNA